MYYIFTVLILIVNFLFQSTLLKYFSIGTVIPNTALIIIVINAVLKGKYRGSSFGLLAGLLQDMFFSQVIGINALIYFLIGYTVGLLSGKVFKENLVLPTACLLVSTIFYHIMYYLAMIFLSINVDFSVILRSIIIKETIYNVTIGVVVYVIILKIRKKPTVRYRGKF